MLQSSLVELGWFSLDQNSAQYFERTVKMVYTKKTPRMYTTIGVKLGRSTSNWKNGSGQAIFFQMHISLRPGLTRIIYKEKQLKIHKIWVQLGPVGPTG